MEKIPMCISMGTVVADNCSPLALDLGFVLDSELYDLPPDGSMVVAISVLAVGG